MTMSTSARQKKKPPPTAKPIVAEETEDNNQTYVRRRRVMEDRPLLPCGWLNACDNLHALHDALAQPVQFVVLGASTARVGDKRSIGSTAATDRSTYVPAALFAFGQEGRRVDCAVRKTHTEREQQRMDVDHATDHVLQEMDAETVQREQERRAVLLVACDMWRRKHQELLFVPRTGAGGHDCMYGRTQHAIDAVARAVAAARGGDDPNAEPMRKLAPIRKHNPQKTSSALVVAQPHHDGVNIGAIILHPALNGYGPSIPRDTLAQLELPVCKQVHLLVRQYASHLCIYDTEQRHYLCEFSPAEHDAVTRHAPMWEDDTLYMCSLTGWAHRCGVYCSVATSKNTSKDDEDTDTQEHAHSTGEDEDAQDANGGGGKRNESDDGRFSVCPLTGLSFVTDKCLKNRFWKPEDGDSERATSHGMDRNEELVVLHRLYQHGDNRRHKDHDRLMTQLLTFDTIRDTWVDGLLQCGGLADIRRYAHEDVQNVLERDLRLAYLMVAMCDIWMLFCQERYALEDARIKRTCTDAMHAMQRTAARQPTPSMVEIITAYHDVCAQRYVAPPLNPALAREFVVDYAQLVVQLWYMIHSKILPPRTTPVHPKAIAFDTFTHAALYTMAMGVCVPAVVRGSADTTILSTQPGLLRLLPHESVLTELLRNNVRTVAAVRTQIMHLLTDAVVDQKFIVSDLDFTLLPFERLDASNFYDISLRNHASAGKIRPKPTRRPRSGVASKKPQ